MPKKSKYTKEILEEAAQYSHSVAGVLRYLGLSQAGGTQAHISRRLKTFGIDTSHFTGQAWNRGRTDPKRKTPEQIFTILPEGSRRPKRNQLRRAMIESGVKEQCSICNLGPVWQERPLTLPIDHINGDWLDNRRENLRFLCPNCHSQCSTFSRRK